MNQVTSPNINKNPIIFFDGVCGLCDAFVDFTLEHDHRDYFLFATLQGETAASLLSKSKLAKTGTTEVDKLRSVILLENGKIYRKSDAALRVLQNLGGFWSFLSLSRYVPRFIRDSAYDFIAANRYRWFGKKQVCRIPSSEEYSRFLP